MYLNHHRFYFEYMRFEMFINERQWILLLKENEEKNWSGFDLESDQ